MAVNARTKKVMHKYGVEILRNIKEAMASIDDAKNGDTQWHDTIEKDEMGNLKVAFDILDDSEVMPPAG